MLQASFVGVYELLQMYVTIDFLSNTGFTYSTVLILLYSIYEY